MPNSCFFCYVQKFNQEKNNLNFKYQKIYDQSSVSNQLYPFSITIYVCKCAPSKNITIFHSNCPKENVSLRQCKNFNYKYYVNIFIGSILIKDFIIIIQQNYTRLVENCKKTRFFRQVYYNKQVLAKVLVSLARSCSTFLVFL